MKAVKKGPLLTAEDLNKIKGWRTSKRMNPDGSYSTHLMSSSDNRVFPTLFQNEDGSWTEFAHEEWKEALAEAERRGEVHYANSPKEADLIARGAWKGTGELLNILSNYK